MSSQTKLNEKELKAIELIKSAGRVTPELLQQLRELCGEDQLVHLKAFVVPIWVKLVEEGKLDETAKKPLWDLVDSNSGSDMLKCLDICAAEIVKLK